MSNAIDEIEKLEAEQEYLFKKVEKYKDKIQENEGKLSLLKTYGGLNKNP